MGDYFNTTLAALSITGAIDTVVLIAVIVWGFVLWIRGISPALFRLGNGLASRKIAIFAKGDNLSSLKDLLRDSGIFRGKNIFDVTRTDDLGKAELASVYLVYWPDWSTDIEKILAMKPDRCALVVYAPRDRGPIPEDQMKNIDGKRHSAVTNFRGRLLNDLVTGMITTSYDR